MRRLRAVISPAGAALGVIVLAGLVLRLRHNDYGLPYVYNVDEGSHFTNRAVAMFGGDSNPGYFQNPSGFTYLVHLALRLQWGRGWPFGDFDAIVRQYSLDPTSIYVTARSLAAVLCMVGAVAVFWVGRRLWGEGEGLVAAAVLAFAFLPVAYSRIAVTDVGTLAPVALAVYGAVRVYEHGARRDYALAGVGVGLAIGFKYTAGLVLLPLLAAGALRARAERRALLDTGLAVIVAVLAFLVTTPWFLLDLDAAMRQIRGQAETAGDIRKLGQADDSGPGYYLHSLTWGLGLAATAAAALGCVLEARRNPVRTLLLVLFPLALFVYLSLQSRFFGRWLLPAYPLLALLCGVALVRIAALVRLRPAMRALALAALSAAVLAQPVAADVRTATLLGREDTRQLARDFLVERFPPRLRMVIEPAVPGRYFRRRVAAQRPSLLRRKQFVRGFSRDVAETRIDYAATLTPRRLDAYRRAGYCVVMTMSVIRGRAENDGVPQALAYYALLERESSEIFRASPWQPEAEPVRFHFDLSYNYYPRAYARPGPEVRIYRLRDCRQGYGPLARGAGRPEAGSTGTGERFGAGGRARRNRPSVLVVGPPGARPIRSGDGIPALKRRQDRWIQPWAAG